MHLFIDTHLNDITYILYDTKIVKKVVENGKEHSKLLMPTLEKLLDGIIPESIIVVNGPGSFTSVRLGVTIAKTLAYTLNIPIRVISSLECIALSINDENKLVGFSDNNGYYIGSFDNDMNLLEDYFYLSNKEFSIYQQDHQVIINVELDYEKIISFGLKMNPINPHKVNPIYIKKLDVEKWLEMLAKMILQKLLN